MKKVHSDASNKAIAAIIDLKRMKDGYLLLSVRKISFKSAY
jgi:hypothetical protein